jgi:formylglycine-generating enzyme required for sulfatase activity
MLGNAWEWVADWYGPYSADHQFEPVGPPTGRRHVLRGGGFASTGKTLRPAFRGSADSALEDIRFTGFRCVRPGAMPR